MGLGSALKRAKKSFKKFTNNPSRVVTALATGGTSEVLRAADKETGGTFREMINPEIPDAADGMRKDEKKAQSDIQTRINRLRAAYGEGDGPEAAAAQAGIDRFISQLSGDSQEEAVAQAGDGYQGDLRAVDESMYDAGLQGGTADLEARRQALEGFVRNRQQITNAAKTAAQKTRSGLQQERLGLEREIAQGTRADPAWNMTAGQRQAQLSGSWQQAWQQQLGVLADGVGAGVGNYIQSQRRPINLSPNNGLGTNTRNQANVDFFNANLGP
jgi:hypothetical protein